MSPAVASLRGITEVWLAVYPLRSDLAAVIDTSALRTKIELKLREHGIQVFGPGDVGRLPTAGIGVDVNPVHSGTLWAIHLEVSVQQMATVSRTHSVDLAVTWRGGVTLLVDDDHVADRVLSGASDAIDQFLDAWLEANPPSR